MFQSMINMHVYCSSDRSSKRSVIQLKQSPKRIKLETGIESDNRNTTDKRRNTSTQYVGKSGKFNVTAGSINTRSTLNTLKHCTSDKKSQRLSENGNSEVIATAVVLNDDNNAPAAQDPKMPDSKQGQLTESGVNLTVEETRVGSEDTRIVVNHNGKELEFLVSGEANMETVHQLVQQLIESGNV